jgi:hypothetical protein
MSMSQTLACIAHKSLEICERCRLRQQNSSATQAKAPALAIRLMRRQNEEANGKPPSHCATPELLQLLTSSLAPLFKDYLPRNMRVGAYSV